MPQIKLTSQPFTEWTMQTVKAQAKGAGDPVAQEHARRALAFYRGDHWQGGDGWAGPRPDPLTTNPEATGSYLKKIEDIFASSNVIAECVNRHVAAIVGIAPGWLYVPNDHGQGQPQDQNADPIEKAQADAQQAESDPLVEELEAALTEWLDLRQAHSEIKKAAELAVATTTGMVRLYIPPGLLDDGKVPPGLSLEDALDLVYFEAVDPEKCAAVTYRKTMDRGACMVWTESATGDGGVKNDEMAELQYTEGRGDKKKTTIKSWRNSDQVGSVELALGGHLLMYEMATNSIISPQVIQLQRQLNFSLTSMGNNNSQAGFMERIITNAQLPGKYVDGKYEPGTKWEGGPGTTVMLNGLPVIDENDNVKGYTTPQPWYKEPSSPEPFTHSLREFREAIYMECRQGHILAQGDGNVSGTSRVQLRADFDTSLADTKDMLENTYRWLLTVMAKLGGILTSQPGKYDAYRATVQVKLNSGPLTDEERRSLIEQQGKGLRSRESTMVMLGIEDPEGEIQRIAAELPQNPMTIDQLASLGVTLQPNQEIEALRRAGFPMTPADEAAIIANHAAAAQLRQSAAEARARSLQPQDQPPAQAPVGQPAQ